MMVNPLPRLRYRCRAHVVESAHTWDYMDPSEKQYGPSLSRLEKMPG